MTKEKRKCEKKTQSLAESKYNSIYLYPVAENTYRYAHNTFRRGEYNKIKREGKFHLKKTRGGRKRLTTRVLYNGVYYNLWRVEGAVRWRERLFSQVAYDKWCTQKCTSSLITLWRHVYSIIQIIRQRDGNKINLNRGVESRRGGEATQESES